ncbi:MAG: hypothetical protein ACRD12_05075, partial [Acidimicrobiales bacterium]
AQPELSARPVGGGSFSGSDISASLAPDEEARFEIQIANRGPESDRFRLTGSASHDGFAARFLDGGSDITSAVNAGAHLTPSLAAGAAYTVVLAVRAPPAPSGGAATSFAVRATAENDARGTDEIVVSLSKRTTTPLARTGAGTRPVVMYAAVALGAGLVLWLLGVAPATGRRRNSSRSCKP